MGRKTTAHSEKVEQSTVGRVTMSFKHTVLLLIILFCCCWSSIGNELTSFRIENAKTAFLSLLMLLLGYATLRFFKLLSWTTTVTRFLKKKKFKTSISSEMSSTNCTVALLAIKKTDSTQLTMLCLQRFSTAATTTFSKKSRIFCSNSSLLPALDMDASANWNT